MMKLRWVERVIEEEIGSYGLYEKVVKTVKVLQYWDKDAYECYAGKWVDVPTVKEEE